MERSSVDSIKLLIKSCIKNTIKWVFPNPTFSLCYYHNFEYFFSCVLILTIPFLLILAGKIFLFINEPHKQISEPTFRYHQIFTVFHDKSSHFQGHISGWSVLAWTACNYFIEWRRRCCFFFWFLKQHLSTTFQLLRGTVVSATAKRPPTCSVRK